MSYNNKVYWENLVGNTMQLREVGWPEWTEAYNKARYKLTAKGTQDVLEKFIDVAPRNILEIGCGVGFWTDLILKRYPNSNYTGVDISKATIQNLNERFHRDNIRFIHADVSLPFEQLDLAITSVEYDLVVCFEVLLHIVKDEAWANAVSNICKLNTKNGNIILSEPFFMFTKPYPENENSVNKVRTYGDYTKIFNQQTRKVVHIQARSYLLDNNFDFKSRFWQKAWNFFFKYYNRLLSIQSEKLGFILGKIAYAFDSLYIKVNKIGHTCRIIVLK